MPGPGLKASRVAALKNKTKRVPSTNVRSPLKWLFRLGSRVSAECRMLFSYYFHRKTRFLRTEGRGSCDRFVDFDVPPSDLVAVFAGKRSAEESIAEPQTPESAKAETSRLDR